MNIKRFNEDIDDNGGRKEMTIRVKNLIEYLSQIDPETPVYLDKDGWDYDVTNAKNEVDVIDQIGLFGRYKDYLYIFN